MGFFFSSAAGFFLNDISFLVLPSDTSSFGVPCSIFNIAHCCPTQKDRSGAPVGFGDVQRILLARRTTPLSTYSTRWVSQSGPSATCRPFLPPFSDPNGASIGRKRDERPAPSKQALRATFGTSAGRFRSATEHLHNFCGEKNKFSAAFFEFLRRILGKIQQKTRRENRPGLGELQGNKQERGQG